ncbi:RHS repeat-associated core domain-containing protein [Myxococcota bacterium]
MAGSGTGRLRGVGRLRRLALRHAAALCRPLPRRVLGLFYNRFRDCDPALGRYLQSDPLGHAGGINLFAYPANPLAEVDLRGLKVHKKPKTPAAGDGQNGKGKPKQEGEGAAPPNAPRKPPPKYPPRTLEARAACQSVVNTMASMQLSPKKRSVVSVFTHEDGTVSVGISGRNLKKNRETAARVEAKLNKGLDPPQYRVAPREGSTPIPEGNIIEKPGGNAPGVCAEPNSAAAAHGHDSPITGMGTRWRGEGDNPHPFAGSNSDGALVHPSQTDPCPTCADPGNTGTYMEHANG